MNLCIIGLNYYLPNKPGLLAYEKLMRNEPSVADADLLTS